MPGLFSKRLAAAPTLDGDAAQWKRVPGLSIRRADQPDQATAKLAYDATHLYVLFDVADSGEAGRYVVVAAVPFHQLRVLPKPGLALRGDLGFISSEA